MKPINKNPPARTIKVSLYVDKEKSRPLWRIMVNIKIITTNIQNSFLPFLFIKSPFYLSLEESPMKSISSK